MKKFRRMMRTLKRRIIKVTFVIAAIVSVLAAFSICTDGIEWQALIISLLCLGYCTWIAVANRGYWIFS